MESGDYRTQSEVIREALRMLREKQAESDLKTLRQLIAEGINSGEPQEWNKDEFLQKSETGREQPPDKIKLTPLAQQDLEAIYLYGLLHFNQERAEAYLETIEHTFTAIRHNKIGIERKELGPGLYSFPVARHTLFFCTKQTASLLCESFISRRKNTIKYERL
nr:type II toxin-antitoxin system ParD family antitoxin [Pectobacterium sp. PL152]